MREGPRSTVDSPQTWTMKPVFLRINLSTNQLINQNYHYYQYHNYHQYHQYHHLRRQDDHKRCPCIRLGIGVDGTTMVLHNFFTDGEAYTRAFIFAATVQPLEDGEDFAGIFVF